MKRDLKNIFPNQETYESDEDDEDNTIFQLSDSSFSLSFSKYSSGSDSLKTVTCSTTKQIDGYDSLSQLESVE